MCSQELASGARVETHESVAPSRIVRIDILRLINYEGKENDVYFVTTALWCQVISD